MDKRKNSALFIRALPFLTGAIILLLSCTVDDDPEVTRKELQDHIMVLSSDSLSGRMTGSAGDSLAAIYIRNEFLRSGLQPLSGNGFQYFEVTNRLLPGPGSFLSHNGVDYVSGKDFMPEEFSESSSAKAEVVFAGYGFRADGEALKWDDYNNIEVKGRWVMILRGDPEPDEPMSEFVAFSNDRDKVMVARDLGAAGVLMVSGPAYDKGEGFPSYSTEGFSAGIPVLRLKRELADRLLEGSGHTIASLEETLNETRKPASFATGSVISAGSELVADKSHTRNVVMVLRGEDEQLRNEYVIMGAHFDHLGMGGASSRVPDTVAIHHGADDNASGVSLMIELAEKLAATKGSHKRSVIFIAFSGEEKGLLGSKHFTENPLADLTRVNAMLNLDMVGRLRDDNSLQIGGVGTAEGLRDSVLATSDTNRVRITIMNEGYGPSDHSSFYGKDIPVLFYSTGAHLDYHTPYDTWDKINYEGMVSISEHLYRITTSLAGMPGRLRFTEAGPKTGTSVSMRRGGVTLGIMPDFAGNVKNGLRADFVTEGKPAALGGMKKGDIITSINGKTVNNIEDYMFRMNQVKHGEIISVEILRNNKKELLLIQL